MERKENQHQILHIWISLGAKFQFQLTVLIFWTKFVQKKHVGRRQKKWTSLLNSE